jgi:DNA topoisomerase-1
MTQPWKTFRHNGVVFPEPFKATGQSWLSPLAEEMLVAWWRQPEERRKDKVFKTNFVHDLNMMSKASDRELRDWPFDLVIKLPPTLKELSPEERKLRKMRQQATKANFGFATIDGVKTPCQYGIEPPGIFIGRGDHPLRGRWKDRITAEDVTLNLDAKAPIPLGKWRHIVEMRDQYWIASWPKPLGQHGRKYLWVAETAAPRQSKDKAKYDKALALTRDIERIRELYASGLYSPEFRTAMYLLDNLALRVGDEKGEDAADTVGVCTLRCEHVSYELDSQEVSLDFLGKDSVRLEVTFIPPRAIFNAIVTRLDSAQGDEPLFPHVSAQDINRFLKAQMGGLTAKTFRTMHGTAAAREFLKGCSGPTQGRDLKGDTVLTAKYANLAAAQRLNHRRTLPKNWEERLAKKQPSREKEFLVAAQDYNLGTSLKSYIDPRVFVDWDPTGSWLKIYSKALRAKFAWALATVEGG